MSGRSGMGAMVALVLLVVALGASVWGQGPEKMAEADLTVSKEYSAMRREKTLMMPESELQGLTEDDFAKMALSDIRLKSGYMRVFQNVVGFNLMNERLSGGVAAARVDLYRRRNDAAPLLLKLLKDNPDSRLEAVILESVEHIPGMDLAPFLEHARVAVRERGMTINLVSAECIAKFLVRNGSTEDWDLLRRWGADRPYFDGLVKSTLKYGEWVRSQAYGPTVPTVRLPRGEGGATRPVPATPLQPEEAAAGGRR